MKSSMRINKQIFSVLFIAALMLACSKDGNDGAVGPQGAQGEQGPPGAQGENGQDGVDGETGTANVIYSEWITSGFPANIMDDLADFDINAPSLTADIIDTGVILVYGRTSGDPDVLQLPVYIPTVNESYYHRIEDIGLLQVRVVSDDGSDVGNTVFDDYRYIIIPGGTPTSGKTFLDYSKMSYEEITAHFNIPE